jgi:hypothetical protein
MVLFTRFFAVDRYRAMYLGRLESLMDGELAPAAFDALVDRAWAGIQEVALEDPEVWPFDHGASLRRAPEALKAGHRRRLTALKAYIEEERARAPEPVEIRGFLLRPLTGRPWVELGNRSARSVDLTGYRLSTSFERVGQLVGAGRELAPGETLRVAGDWGEEALPGGGALVLWRSGASQRVVADFVFYGHQTPEFFYGRVAAGPGGAGTAWAFSAPGGKPAGPERASPAAPPYTFRQGVVKQRSGDLTIWCAPSRYRVEKIEVDTVLLKYREISRTPGIPAGEFQEVELVWDERMFRYAIVLEKNDARPRTAYYFLVRTKEGLERSYPLGAPALSYFLPQFPEIYINEVCPRPGSSPGVGEFVELYNAGDGPVSLRGMHLSDDRRNPAKWRITEDVVMNPGGYAVFYADGLDRGLHANFKLSNSGEFLGLYGRLEEGSLLIDGIAFRGVPSGQSWGRKQDDTRGFQVWKDPTPGKRNLPKIPEEYLEKARK